MMNNNSTISQERLELIYESALRQFRSGRSLAKVIVNLYGKGLEEDEAEKIANKAYYKYREEEGQRELQESYTKPLIPIPGFLKTFIFKIISFVLSMLTGHFINLERFKKGNEKRVQ